MKQSVSSWIFFTNKLEFSGLETEQDTKTCLFKNIKRTVNEKEVIKLYDVIKKSYNDKTNVTSHVINECMLKEFHKIMFDGILNGEEGKYRTIEAESLNLDGTTYKHPHHEYVTYLTRNLFTVASQLAKYIDMIDQELNFNGFICSVVGLASFYNFILLIFIHFQMEM